MYRIKWKGVRIETPFAHTILAIIRLLNLKHGRSYWDMNAMHQPFSD